jgi:hypothetical protein
MFIEYVTITDIPADGMIPLVFSRGWELFTSYIGEVL